MDEQIQIPYRQNVFWASCLALLLYAIAVGMLLLISYWSLDPNWHLPNHSYRRRGVQLFLEALPPFVRASLIFSVASVFIWLFGKGFVEALTHIFKDRQAATLDQSGISNWSIFGHFEMEWSAMTDIEIIRNKVQGSSASYSIYFTSTKGGVKKDDAVKRVVLGSKTMEIDLPSVRKFIQKKRPDLLEQVN